MSKNYHHKISLYNRLIPLAIQETFMQLNPIEANQVCLAPRARIYLEWAHLEQVLCLQVRLRTINITPPQITSSISSHIIITSKPFVSRQFENSRSVKKHLYSRMIFQWSLPSSKDHRWHQLDSLVSTAVTHLFHRSPRPNAWLPRSTLKLIQYHLVARRL